MNAKALFSPKEFTGVRVSVESTLQFDEVIKRLREFTGHTTVREVVALAEKSLSEADYIREVTNRFVGQSGFMLFSEIDHGGWIGTFGIQRRSVRWILGNPLIAITMIRHDINAGLFVPVELLVTEQLNGSGTSLLFIRPSSQIVVEDNPPLLQAAKDLDVKFDALISQVTQD